MLFNKLRSFSNSGFTLTELMVAVGIGSIVILGLSTTFQQIVTSWVTADSRQEQTSFKYDLDGFLANHSLCSLAFTMPKPVLGNSANPVDITDRFPQLTAGSTTHHLKISSIKLENPVLLTGMTYRADVTATGQITAEIFGIKDFKTTSHAYYTTDPDGNITQCFASTANALVNCLALGGTWSLPNGPCNYCIAMGGQMNKGKCSIGIGNNACAATPLHAVSGVAAETKQGFGPTAIIELIKNGGSLETYKGARDWALANKAMLGLSQSDVDALIQAENNMSDSSRISQYLKCGPNALTASNPSVGGEDCAYMGSSGHIAWAYRYRYQTCSNVSVCDIAYVAGATAEITFSCN